MKNILKIIYSSFLIFFFALLFVSPISTLAQTIDINNGLVGHWTFDENTGSTVHDSSGNNLNGTMIGGVTWAPGRVGNASLNFDGSTGYIKLPDDVLLHMKDNSSFSISLWFYANADSGDRTLIRYDDYDADDGDSVVERTFYTLSLDWSTMKLYVYYGNTSDLGNINGTINVNPNTWNNVVFVRDIENSKERIYLNSSTDADESDLIGGSWETTGQYPLIGRFDNGAGASGYWSGYIDDIRIYNRALSGAESLVLYEYNETPAPSIPYLNLSNVSNISTSSITLNASIINTGGASSTDRGFHYGTTISYGSTASSTGTFGNGNYSQNITGLTCNTTYHYRAFAINSAGTATTTDSTFTTSACPVEESTPVIDSTPAVSSSRSGSRSQAYLNYLSSIKDIKQTIDQFIPKYTFLVNLSQGQYHNDVKRLQSFLNQSGYIVSNFGFGSIGLESKYFGNKTYNALKKYQSANNIPATGFFGPMTRGFINNLK